MLTPRFFSFVSRTFILAVVVAIAAPACVSQSAPANQPTVGQAAGMMATNDFAGAAKILEQIVVREPGNGRAWRTLALANQQLKQWDRAIEANKRALDVEPENLTPYISLGAIYAAKGDKDQAFLWLSKARASRRVDMTQIETMPELATLKSDSRYAALHPTPADFADPFVEPVKIIREWDGEAANDQFGWIARNIGDVDGDGVPDVVTSAPSSNHGGNDAGRIYVYSTKSGKLLWTADGNAGDELGTGIEAAGDTNGDGIPDVIASGPVGGYAKIYSGRDGKVLLTLHGEKASDDFGRHADGVGDVNHDGFADVIVGAPANGAAGENAGRAYVYSGKDGSLLLTLTGEGKGDAFGSAVAGYADKNRLLLIVGAPNAGPNHTGRTYVYDSLSTTPKFVIESDETGAQLGGMFVSVPGDVDGDGVPDVYASDWANRAERSVDWARLCIFRKRRPYYLDVDRRNGGRGIWHQPVGCRRCGWRWARRPDRGCMAIQWCSRQRRPRLPLFRQGWALDQNVHLQDSGRYVRI